MTKKVTPVCPICKQVRPEKILSGLFDDRFGVPGTYDIVQCSSCGMEQIWPQPTERELKELYEQFYNWGGEQGTAYTNLRERFLASVWYRLWVRLDGDIFFHLRRGAGRLLDVGCNEGRGLAFYSRNGFQAEGLELNERAAAVAREKGFVVHTEPLAEFRPPEPYDVAVLSNVLEHVVDPVASSSTCAVAAPRGTGLDLLPQWRQPVAAGLRTSLDKLSCSVSSVAFLSGNPGGHSHPG